MVLLWSSKNHKQYKETIFAKYVGFPTLNFSSQFLSVSKMDVRADAKLFDPETTEWAFTRVKNIFAEI